MTLALTPEEWAEEDMKIEEEGIASEANELFVLGFLALICGTLDEEGCLEALQSMCNDMFAP